MKSFKEIAENYQEILDEAKLKKKKIWKADDKGNLKKTLIKYCADSDGQKVNGFKLVDGKKCVKMSQDEIKTRFKAMRKSKKTKRKNASKNAKKAAIISKRRKAKNA